MKRFIVFLAVRCCLLALAEESVTANRPITKVVKMLQDMLVKSNEDGDSERILYGKYKCYCDTNKEEKTTSIEKLDRTIQTLENEIDELQSRNGELSRLSKKLVTDIAANKKSRSDATALRQKDNQDYEAMKLDSETAAGQIEAAIAELSSVGADQTAASAADHEKFMANYGALLSVRKGFENVLRAKSSKATPEQAAVISSFLQKPFTSTYTSQAGEVLGILKDMLDTFTANLESARIEEEQAAKTFNAFIALKTEEFENLTTANEDAQEELSDNDSQLSSKNSQLGAAKATKDSDEEFLASLTDMCAKKAAQYRERTVLRRNEQAALSEAIAILNSDAAFQAFGKIESTADFLQRSSIRVHGGDVSGEKQMEQARTLLRRADKKTGSLALARIASLLETHNPFSVVLQEINKMIALIGEEENADTEKVQWCEAERTENNKALGDRVNEIEQLKLEISTLKEKIEHETTGLIIQISTTQASLASNEEEQKTETANRKEANAEYQRNIAHLREVQDLIQRAVSVLKAYYSKIAPVKEMSLAQSIQTPPKTWSDEYMGQSTNAGSAIEMLVFILDNAKQEEKNAHDDEAGDQEDYEKSMASLKATEKNLMDQLSTLKVELAEAKKQLLEAEQQHETTVAQKLAIEKYLLEIKPGCDFIVDNYKTRSGNRETEKQALEAASALLKKTPAYLTAVAAKHNETLGECLDVCAGAEDAVECKACRAKVTIPGYCAGHPDTIGCEK